MIDGPERQEPQSKSHRIRATEPQSKDIAALASCALLVHYQQLGSQKLDELETCTANCGTSSQSNTRYFIVIDSEMGG